MSRSSVLITVCFAAGTVHGQTVVYVDDTATGANDGSSWCDAYVYLQDALAAAAASGGAATEIRVAQGTYEPDQGTGQTSGAREATFQLLNGVALRGGYAGCGQPDPDARDVAAFETVLSGDLAGNDGLNFANNAENSLHVVTGSGTDTSAVQDGFTITAGNANAGFPNGFGGGMYNNSGGPTVTNCIFSANYGGAGGGMGNYEGSSPSVTDCTFNGNSGFSGGGMYNRTDSSPTVTNCTFSDNLVNVYHYASSGGGMSNRANSSPTVTNCMFTGNRAGGHGAGMVNWSSNPTVTNCTFSDNRVVQNYTSISGGGMVNWSSSPTVTNCTFSGNWVRYDGGGAMFNSSSSPTVTNCMFTGNRASVSTYGTGAAMFNSGGTPTVTNCTFTGNSVPYGTGAGMLNLSSSPTVTNCILWSNIPTQIYSSDGTPVVNYSIVQGGWAGAGGIGVVDADPLFDDALRVMPGSPAIDAGSNGAVPQGITTDLDDNSRFVDDPNSADCLHGGDCGPPPIVDMGAYEFQAQCAQPGECDDADPCTIDTCSGGFCWNTPIDCDDGIFCNGAETCNSVTGQCLPGSAVDCSGFDDDCNTGICNEDTDQCEADPTPHEGDPCDDGLHCNENETCQSGACTGGSPVDCSALTDQCNTGFCNEDTDQCEGNPGPHEGDPCDNALFCTLTDTCNGGTCVGSGDPCPGFYCDEGNDECIGCFEDVDCDGVPNGADNCPLTPNGPVLGTCVAGVTGVTCPADDECDTTTGSGDGLCSMDQENSDSDADGDACDADDDNDN